MLDALVRRHPMLRAVVDADGQQRVLPEAPPVEVEVVDLSALDEATRAARLAERREALSHRILPAERAAVWKSASPASPPTGSGCTSGSTCSSSTSAAPCSSSTRA
ncbi:MAG: hypothetical protein R3F65_29405 [bacterium]